MKLKKEDTPFKLMTYGGKAKSNLTKLFGKECTGGFLEVGEGNPVTFSEVCAVAEAFAEEDFGAGTVIHNEFLNVISFNTKKSAIPSSSAFIAEADQVFEAYEQE